MVTFAVLTAGWPRTGSTPFSIDGITRLPCKALQRAKKFARGRLHQLAHSLPSQVLRLMRKTSTAVRSLLCALVFAQPRTSLLEHAWNHACTLRHSIRPFGERDTKAKDRQKCVRGQQRALGRVDTIDDEANTRVLQNIG